MVVPFPGFPSACRFEVKRKDGDRHIENRLFCMAHTHQQKNLVRKLVSSELRRLTTAPFPGGFPGP